MTNPNDKIFIALKRLEKINPNVEVKIFIPNLKVKNIIEKLNIYLYKYNTIRRYWQKIQNFTQDFQTLNIKIIEYSKFINFGFSAIDIDTNNSFIHISKVRKNEYIKDAEYFNIHNDRSISKLISKIIEGSTQCK